MPGLSAKLVAMFTVAVVGQLAGIALLPKTMGYTHIGYSLASLTVFAIAFAATAQLIQNGVNLSLMIPIMSTIIPLATIAIGIFAYGEVASIPKILLLIAACVLVGFATRF